MPDLAATLRENGALLGLLLAALLAFTLVWIVVLTRQVVDLRRRMASMTRGSDGRSLEGVLESHLQRVYDVAREVKAVDARATTLEGRGRKSIQRVGLVRFNPFEDTGSNQSFAVALLDDDEDGIVISSLHSRQTTRVYAKPISAGIGDAPLSAEEAEAVRLARTTRGTRPRA
ncbi:MAG: DUF4446 family protein [Chloroflexi bacterium]|nr:DUF4446 family protein [Chloroflexota bacterium]